MLGHMVYVLTWEGLELTITQKESEDLFPKWLSIGSASLTTPTLYSNSN